MQTIQTKWDQIYQQHNGALRVVEVLQNNHYLLPKAGIALDLACGMGGNAVFLAEKGLTVKAWDISSVAIEQLALTAKERKLAIEAEVRDVVANPPEENSVDVLLVSHFLARELCPAIIAAIKPGGLLFYQTYCQEKVHEVGPKNPNYLLADNELMRLFSEMKLRVYREEAMLGEHTMGMRNQAWLLAEKPML
tara:strand:- start:577 stop:1155 length:579 start_codon:yes stop_codon:yes gene_type:complete